MKLYNKTDMSLTVPLIGEAGNLETITIQPHGRVELPDGFSLQREMKQLHVTDYEPVALQPANKKGDKE